MANNGTPVARAWYAVNVRAIAPVESEAMLRAFAHTARDALSVPGLGESMLTAAAMVVAAPVGGKPLSA
jgi:hypothetical protein